MVIQLFLTTDLATRPYTLTYTNRSFERGKRYADQTAAAHKAAVEAEAKVNQERAEAIAKRKAEAEEAARAAAEAAAAEAAAQAVEAEETPAE